jgi:Putative metal-binding motif
VPGGLQEGMGPMDLDAHRTPTRPRGRRKVLAGAALTAVVFASTLAFAEWLASGTGEGYAQATTAQPLTTESATAAATLYPGGTGDLALRIHNPNPFPVTVTTVAQNGPITSDDAACDAAGHGVTFTTFTGALALAGGETKTFTLNDVLAMALSSANECQGANFTVPVSLNGGSGGGETDEDGDGYTASAGDCDDANATVFPGATEVLGDGLDNDCDGTTDEGLGGGETDEDGDGYAEVGGDCDDSNATIFPGATEVLGDGVDNDCDGTTDEGFGG